MLFVQPAFCVHLHEDVVLWCVPCKPYAAMKTFVLHVNFLLDITMTVSAYLCMRQKALLHVPQCFPSAPLPPPPPPGVYMHNTYYI